jgi:methyltransferase (TIGR00027 family)
MSVDMFGPSETALHVARLRAAHQLRENGSVFRDSYALSIIGQTPETLLETEQASPLRRGERLFVSSRSRFAEESAMQAILRGTEQLVVLGAGYDTFCLRFKSNSNQILFELDHPETQRSKRKAIENIGATLPQYTHLIEIDFEKDALFEKLQSVGFREDKAAFFFWLGVVPYLKEETVFNLLGSLRRLPDAEIVFDYGQDPNGYSGLRRERYQNMIDEAQNMGEPWLSFFEPQDLASKLRSLGYSEFEDLGVSEIGARYIPSWKLPPGTPGGHIMRARFCREAEPLVSESLE